MRIVTWNIRAGGGRRAEAIARRLARRAPDVVALAARGLVHQLTTADRARPATLVLGAMPVPNRVGGRKYPFLDAVLACARGWRLGPALFVGDTNSGRRGLDEQAPAFNAREEGWIDALAASGWADAFRHRRARARAYTWHPPNGRNGFRIDQAFVNPTLLPRLRAATYAWGRPSRGGRRDALSDHAALLVDLAAGPRRPAR
jgi:exonuclease III